MSEILRTRSHLMASSESIDKYLSLNNHLQIYEIFVESPTELYEPFRFPAEIVSHVAAKRQELIDLLNTEKKLN